MKFVLISPYNNIHSYGIRSISTFLRNRGVSLSSIYLINEFYSPYDPGVFDQLISLCGDADAIGISVMSNYFTNCAEITNRLKKELHVPIVWGGAHPTVDPKESLDYCDIAVIGEGEETMLEIINSLREGRKTHYTKGAFVRQGEKIFENDIRPLMQIENLPIIDNDFSQDYILIKNRICKVNYKILQRYMTGDYITLSSFGCAFDCSYCINNRLKKIYCDTIRFRKTEGVIDEIVSAREKMKFIRHISFDDDAFICRDTAGLEKFAKDYKKNINLPFFVSGMNPLFVSDEKMKILTSAGMDRVRLGIQTGSARSKILYNRNISNDKIIAAAKIINNYNKKLMMPSFDIMLDNPFESKSDIIETIDLISKLPRPFTLNLYSLTFYPGTDIYEKALSAGIIKDKIRDIYNKHYYDINATYLNFVIVLFTIFKTPAFLLKTLLNKRIVQKEIKVPKIIFGFFKSVGYLKWAIDFLIHGDPYTLSRHLRVRLTRH